MNKLIRNSLFVFTGLTIALSFATQTQADTTHLKSLTTIKKLSTNAYEDLYCDYYADSNTSGYSLYRRWDGKDIGNAVWRESSRECVDAAWLANRVQEGIVCGRYANKSSGHVGYSIYRISDGQDLGNAMITDFGTCQDAVYTARRGIFCSTFVFNGVVRWSMYDVRTGRDFGQLHYATFERCLQDLPY